MRLKLIINGTEKYEYNLSSKELNNFELKHLIDESTKLDLYSSTEIDLLSPTQGYKIYG